MTIGGNDSDLAAFCTLPFNLLEVAVRTHPFLSSKKSSRILCDLADDKNEFYGVSDLVLNTPWIWFCRSLLILKFS
jgi:hypothetical protein